MVSEEDEFSWLRFICTIVLGLIVFFAFAEIMTVIFFGPAVIGLLFHLPDLFSILLYYQLAIVLMAILSIIAIKIRHTTFFYALFVVVVCLCFIICDMLL